MTTAKLPKHRRATAAELESLRARAVLENTRDAVVSMDLRGRITQFNRAAEAMFGYSAAEVIGGDVAVLMPSPYREEHAGYVERYRRTGEARAIGRIREVEAVRKSGERFPIELSVVEVLDGVEPTYTAIIRDVSAFRTMVETVVRESDFSNRLIDAAPMIVLVLDKSGAVQRFNAYMERLCGYSLAEVRGRDSFELLVHEADRAGVRHAFARAMAGDPVLDYVNRLVSRSGEVRSIRWSGEVLRDPDGVAVSMLAVGEDITHRLRSEEELRRLEQRAREKERLADIGAIAAKLVHDFGNPLSGLSMQAQLLQRRVTNLGDESIALPVERILAAAGRLNDLVRGFMDFAREQRLEVREIDLSKMLSDVVGLWEPVAAKAGITLRLEAQPAAKLRGDEVKLRRVFDNLVKNGIEAVGARPGSVRVRLEHREPDRVRVFVEDDGPGVVPGTDVFRLFETTKHDGTGIGLAVSKQIVVAHGGTITITDAEPRGASVMVELPMGGPEG